MQNDSFTTINAQSEGLYKEKGSKFLAFAVPVRTQTQIKEILDEARKKYHDARHICYAFMLGPEKKDYRSSDDGEPSGTAGKPILGAILSAGITDVLIYVVRYFGGTKLGTSGLINAYKTSATDAIQNAEIIEKTVDNEFRIEYDYVMMNDVMKVIKDLNPNILSQNFDNNCQMSLSIRASEADILRARLEKIESLRIE